MKRDILYCLFLFSMLHTAVSQEMPPISNFDTKSYSAGNQNWMLDQAKNKTIYVANNSGLLSFNGEQWVLNKVPDGSSVRSVLVHDDRIFTGSYMDIGYWEMQPTGNLTYTSLKSSLEGEFLDGEQFWHIQNLGDYIVFQSLRRLYIYNIQNHKITIIPSDNTITNLFRIGEKLMYQVAYEGLYAIHNAAVEKVIPDTALLNRILVGVFDYKNKLLVVTRNSGVFTFSEGKLEPFQTKGKKDMPSEGIFTSLLTKDKKLVLGTIGQGLLMIDLENKDITQIVQPILLNNTVLSLLEDSSGNIWCGLDNGISVVNKNSSIELFTDTFGEIGTVYCSYQKNNLMHLGTNQGLYYKDHTTSDAYQLVPGTNGQVWTVAEIDGILYMGHNVGTFVVDGKKATQIFSFSGTWEIKKIGTEIIQGHYNGITHFNPDHKDKISYIKNYNLSSRNIVVQDSKTLWVGHDHKGVFKLKLTPSYSDVVELKNYSTAAQDGLGLTIFRFNNNIYYSTAAKVYKYEAKKDDFTAVNELQKVSGKQHRTTGISKVLEDGMWWSFGEEEIFYVIQDAFQNKLSQKSIALPMQYRSVANSFENISLLNDQHYLVGSNMGYATFSMPFVYPDVEKLSIKAVEVGKKGYEYQSQNLKLNELNLANDENYVRFKFSIPQYEKLNDVKYSYKIENYIPEWSAWETDNMISFKNLPPGDYIFQVKGRYANKFTNTASYHVIIAAPWYASFAAYAFYSVLFLVLIYFVNRFYTNYYKRQHIKLMQRTKKEMELSQLEAQKEIMQLQNQKLEVDVASKNRELAASTMNLIKKNEFLNHLKFKLNKIEDNNDIDEVIKLINKDVAEKDNWKLFKEAFDNADKNFLQSVKEQHPNLTSNDLKLCAYLRLNLSSKEIAPLLNISVRSVEIKRYRLRKKMNLEHEAGLTDYILSFNTLNK